MALSRDARLIDRVQHGDDAAFERLHARHQPEILAFCRHLTGSREDAEDAVQHTFLAAYRRIADSEQTLEWRPWLFTVARNRCLTLLRARREHSLAEPDVATSFDGLAIEVERRQELRDLVRDMARLPEPQRAALVLSQLDALSYREIGTVLGVTPEKVKALVFQARSSLASTREAREAPCFEIRREIATARGPALRRRLLRRHVGQCDGCRDFEVTVMRQRNDLGILLPVAPSAGLGQAILGGALVREGATAASAGGAAVASGSAGAGLAGTLAALGASGMLKLAVVVTIAGTSTAGALAADLPARIERASPWHTDVGSGAAPGRTGVAPGGPVDGQRTPEGSAGDLPLAGGKRIDGHDESAPSSAGQEGRDAVQADAGQGDTGAGGSGGSDEEHSASGGGSIGLPPGLAKKDELPPGLAKRDELPPGLAKRDGAAPGQSGKAPKGPPSGGGPAKGNNGGGNGGGQSQGPPAAGDPAGGSQGNGNGGGEGQGSGGGQGNGGGNGNAGGQGNGGGNGNGNGNGNGGGGGGGNPH
jgi:RNA polymerase sigma factor (sigma-70 family)